MADYLVGEELQDYLIAQGVGQLPAAAPSLSVPVIVLHPLDGAARPRQDGDTFVENTAVTIIEELLAPPAPTDAWLETAVVDVHVRSTSNRTAKLVQRQIRDLIAPRGDFMGRKHWTMSDLLVERSWVWKPDQRLGEEDRLYGRVQSFMFEARRKSLAGLAVP